MARVKHTKSALKEQRDALARFKRYLPTLKLKKQQLQVEVWRVEARAREKRAESDQLREEISSWVALFAEPFDFAAHLRTARLVTGQGNIAGVAIPVLEVLEFAHESVDLFQTPPWVDDGLRVVEQLARLRIERSILDEQQRLLEDELRVASQRVNLFEKVKIPEARENIRAIRVYLGDQQTAEVVRGKIAKAKSASRGEEP